MVFHGPISSKNKFGIGHKRKNVSSFQRHKDAISETKVVDQPPAETNSTETTQPPQKRRAENHWREARGIFSCDKMVQKIMMERDCLLAQNTSLQGHVDKAKAATSQLAHQKFLGAKAFRSQIIRHQEEHVFSIAQLRFQFDNQIEESFAMAHTVTEKVLWTKRNESRALLITRSKCKLKEKIQRKVG